MTATMVPMNPRARLETSGVALLATRLSVLGEDPCGGSEVVLWEDASILRAAGIPVRVYGRGARAGAPVLIVPLRTNAPLITSIEYGGQFLSKERESLIIAYNEPSLAGWAPERTIARFDWSTPLPRYWNWPGWRGRFQRARYLFPSESESQEFLREYGQIPGSCVSVVPNAVDLKLFRPQDGCRVAGSTHKPRVGFAGQWVPRKGIGDLLAAWPLVKTQVPAAELALAGGPKLWKVAGQNAGAERCAESVRQIEEKLEVMVVGPVARTKMPEFWNSLDVAVVPSHYEPFGLVALEALACGVPVVATAVGGLKEIVEDGKSGLLIAPEQPEALAKAVTLLLNNGPLRLRLAEGARRRAETFSIERRARELLQLLSEPGKAA